MSNDTAPGCLTRILQLFGIRPRPRENAATPLPYHAVDALLSPAEVSLYHVLLTVAGDRATICPKVGLGDLFFAKTGDRSRTTSYRNRIDRKHVDFLFCDPRTLAPLGAVELDDASHGRADRVARDAFVDDVFAAAGLPLVHVTAQRAYAPNALRAQLAAADPGMAGVVGGGEEAGDEAESAQPEPECPEGYEPARAAVSKTSETSEVAKSGDQPACPTCGTPMVLRTAKRGPHAGEPFWACPNYPQCRGILPLTPASP